MKIIIHVSGLITCVRESHIILAKQRIYPTEELNLRNLTFLVFLVSYIICQSQDKGVHLSFTFLRRCMIVYDLKQHSFSK